MTSGTPGGQDELDGPLWAAASVPVGAAVEPDLLRRDALYAATLLREFNAITPENAMKWGPIHPHEGSWRFDPADELVRLAGASGLRVHGHTLVWHEQLPYWLTPTLSQRAVARILATHIETLVGRYAGRVASWDVVNEAVDGDGGPRNTYFGRTYGDGYVAEAFRLAHAADPDARLYYNDFDAERAGKPKSDGVYLFVRRLLDEGVPIHGVGLQMHLRADRPPRLSAVRDNIARLVALGLEVRISEMDVRIRDVLEDDPLAVQRRVYQDTIAACVGMPGLTGVTFWGVSDAHTWYRDDAPLLFDRDYLPKPAYFGARAALG